MTNYAFYLGCITPNRYPGIEVATKKVLEAFGIKLLDVEGASCCPAPGVFGSFDLESWAIIAARNITIAEGMKADIATTCNGCYATLQEANHLLKHDKSLMERVNKSLESVGRKYQGNIQVKHVAEILTEEVGLERIKTKIKNPLSNIKVAAHYGCHFLKPSETRMHGSTENPTFLDELIRTLGAESVNYKDKGLCCGAGGGVRSTKLDVALDMTAEKIDNMMESGADCVTTPCAFCHLQFDRGQIELNERFKKNYQLPVVFMTQLVGLAMGMDSRELGLHDNSIPAESLLKKI